MTLENANDLIAFFQVLLSDENEIEDIKTGIKENLKDFADQHDIDAKAVSDAYALFKKMNKRVGKSTNEDYSELSSIVEAYFNIGDAE